MDATADAEDELAILIECLLLAQRVVSRSATACRRLELKRTSVDWV
jgi:hypothetical protein